MWASLKASVPLVRVWGLCPWGRGRKEEGQALTGRKTPSPLRLGSPGERQGALISPIRAAPEGPTGAGEFFHHRSSACGQAVSQGTEGWPGAGGQQNGP